MVGQQRPAVMPAEPPPRFALRWPRRIGFDLTWNTSGSSLCSPASAPQSTASSGSGISRARPPGLVACATMTAALALSLVAFLQLLQLAPAERAFDVTVAQWLSAMPLQLHDGSIGTFSVPWGFRLDPLSGMMILDRHRHRHADPRLLDRLHGRRAARRLRAVLLLPEPVLLLHAHARPGKQLPGDVRGLGGRRPVLVPADWLLVREEERR